MSRPQPTLLVTLTGRDRPGVTSRLFSGLSAHDLTVLDVEQVVIRGHLVLGVLLACPQSPDLTAIHRRLTSLADDLGMNAELTLGSGEQSRQRGRLHVTVLGHPLRPDVIAAIAGRIAAGGANIDKIGRLARRPVTCIEFEVSGADPDTLRAELARESVGLGADIAVQRGGLHRRAMRLVVMDVDSTLLQDEAIDLLADRAGCAAEVSALTTAAMRGEIEYADALRRRVGLLAGLNARVLDELIDRPGKERMLRQFAAEAGVPLSQTVAVGDGANDLDMIAAAGLGIAFNAKPAVRSAADTSVSVPHLDAILYLLGISRDDVEAADAADTALATSGLER